MENWVHMDVAEVDWPSRAESGADKTALDVSRPEAIAQTTPWDQQRPCHRFCPTLATG